MEYRRLRNDEVNDFCREFVENVPIEDLYAEIRKRTGLDDLVFSKKIVEDRHGRSRIEIESQDLADRTGFLKLLFKELVISTFNTETKITCVSKDENEQWLKEPYYIAQAYIWGTIAFAYTHPGGGSNGHTFMSYRWSPEKGWEFD
jgi:hypothetical protein